MSGIAEKIVAALFILFNGVILVISVLLLFYPKHFYVALSFGFCALLNFMVAANLRAPENPFAFKKTLSVLSALGNIYFGFLGLAAVAKGTWLLAPFFVVPPIIGLYMAASNWNLPESEKEAARRIEDARENLASRPPDGKEARPFAKIVSDHMTGTFRAAFFSNDARDYFSNSRRTALASFAIPLALLIYSGTLYCQAVGFCGHENEEFGFWGRYIATMLINIAVTVPKFFIFFWLVLKICRFSKQTDYFWAFVSANNWFYVVYIFMLAVQLAFSHYMHSYPLYWEQVAASYFAVVLFFLAQNVLRLMPVVAQLVPAAFIFAHILVRMITGFHGLMIVF